MLQTCSYILYSSTAIKTSWHHHHHHSLTIIHTRDRTYMWKRKRHHQQWSNFLHQWWWWWWQRRRRCDGVIWDLSCFRQNRSTCQQDPRYVYLYRTTYDRVLSSRLQIWGNLIRNYFGWTLSDICLQFSQDIFKVNCFFVFFYIKIYKVY